jgi:hypothetical protein
MASAQSNESLTIHIIVRDSSAWLSRIYGAPSPGAVRIYSRRTSSGIGAFAGDWLTISAFTSRIQ